MNGSLNRGLFPDSLKILEVLPLHTKCTAIDVSDFRPALILPLLSKIYESVVFNRL